MDISHKHHVMSMTNALQAQPEFLISALTCQSVINAHGKQKDGG